MEMAIIKQGTVLYPEEFNKLKYDAPSQFGAKGDIKLLSSAKKVAIIGDGKHTDFVIQDAINSTIKYMNQGYTIVTNISGELNKVVIDTAIKEGGNIITVINGDINQYGAKEQGILQKIIKAGGFILSVNPEKRPNKLQEKKCYAITATLADVIHVALLGTPQVNHILEYADMLNKKVLSSKHPRWNITNRGNYYIWNKNMLDQRVEEIKAGINVKQPRILCIVSGGAMSDTMYSKYLAELSIEEYEILNLFTKSYYDLDSMAQVIIGLQPDVVQINPNSNQELLLNLWSRYPQIEQYSYLYYPKYDSIKDDAKKKFITGCKYEHNSGTDVRLVLDAAVAKRIVPEYQPAEKSIKDAFKALDITGYMKEFMDEE